MCACDLSPAGKLLPPSATSAEHVPHLRACVYHSLYAMYIAKLAVERERGVPHHGCDLDHQSNVDAAIRNALGQPRLPPLPADASAVDVLNRCTDELRGVEERLSKTLGVAVKLRMDFVR